MAIQTTGNTSPIQSNEIPEGLAQSIQQPYIQNGLTYQSNNKFVMQRDTAGNIILDANTDTIQHLIIEPVVEKIMNKSVVEVFDTRFNYFKFPAKSKGIPSNEFDLNIDLDTDAPEQDSISGHYVAPAIQDSSSYPILRTKHRLSYPSSWDPNGEGPVRIPFSVPIIGPLQLEAGTFTVTQEIIDTLQETNSTIKFRAVLLSFPAASYTERNTGFLMKLVRTMPKQWRNRTEVYGWPKSPSGQELFDTADWPSVYKTSQDQGSDFINLTLDYIIHPDDFVEFDKYEIQAVAGGPAWWSRGYSYWDIDVIPDPGSGYGLQYDF